MNGASRTHTPLSLCAHTHRTRRSLDLWLSIPANPWRSSHRKSHDITLLIYFAPRTMACVCRLPNYCYYHRLHAAAGPGKIRAGAHTRKSAWYGSVETTSRKHTLQRLFMSALRERRAGAIESISPDGEAAHESCCTWGASLASFMNATSITGNQSDANSFVANQALDFITYFLTRDQCALFIVFITVKIIAIKSERDLLES